MKVIAGVDEVGRGPLAGPVLAAAVVLPFDHSIEGLRDSKKLSKKQREALAPKIKDQAIGIGIGRVEVSTIDKINIREATFMAMGIALNNLPERPDEALIDGSPLNNQKIPNKGIIGGDDIVDSIKAASIIAKVTRDRIMSDYGTIFPEYGFENHKGYGTKAHMMALEKYKATPIHRRTFKPVMEKMPTLNWLSNQNRIKWMGEKLAALYLCKKGMKILEMNWVDTLKDEVSIIALQKQTLVFIDVNTTFKPQRLVDGESQTRKKIGLLVQVQTSYTADTKEHLKFRIDSVLIKLKNRSPKIEYFKGIYEQ